MATRKDIAPEYKWKLEDLYASDAEWEREYEEVTGAIDDLAKLERTLTGSAEALADGLAQMDRVSHKLERLYVYARMRRDEDNANPTYQALADRAQSLSVRLSSAVSFVNPLLLSMDEATLRSWIEHPLFKDHAFGLRDLLRQKKHVLDAPQERLLSMAGEFSGGARDIFTMLNNADLDFGSVEHAGETLPLTHASYIGIMQSGDRALRKKAYEKFYAEFTAHINTIAAAYATSVKKDVFYARARNYTSAREKALFADNVSEQVYDSLIETVHRYLPVLHRYVALKQRALGVDQMHMYDIYAPIVADVDNKFTYEQGVELVKQALAPLGEDYARVLKSAFTDGWVDVFETPGKTSGAYSWGVYGTHPYVLLNHRDDLESVYTIAHELGHAMHTYYSDKNQPYPLAGYAIFVAEVASTVNELLLTKHLLATTEDAALRRYVLNHYIEQFRTTVLRQTMFAEFEHIAHEMAEQNKPLTAEVLSDAYARLNAMYHGPAMAADDIIRYEWARIPHFYNAFYVYKYATGLSCAVAIVNNLQKPGMLQKYLGFLAGGGSAYPLELLERAGVTLADAVEACMREFDRALGELEALEERS